MCTYDIDSGVKVSVGTLQSYVKPCLWPHNKSLQAMTIFTGEDSQLIVNIFEIWPTFVNILAKPLPINLDPHCQRLPVISFAQAVHWISAIINNSLVVIDIQNSDVLLKVSISLVTSCLSPDGSLLVAYHPNNHVVWKYCPEEGYTQWMMLPDWSESPSNLQNYLFSPTLSSVLIVWEDFLEIKHLDDKTTTPKNRCNYCEQFSTDGTYSVTVPSGGQIITITNLNGIYSQSIKPGFSVWGLALTKNVLLVYGDDKVVGWRLTEEGMVDGVSGDEVSDQDGSLWTVSALIRRLHVGVEGCTGALWSSEGYLLWYNAETGEELEEDLPDTLFWRWFNGYSDDPESLYSCSYHNFSVCNDPPEDDLPVSIPWYKGGWVKYPEGKYWHKFWLPVHWRSGWERADWLNNVTILRLKMDTGLAIIKFHLESPPH